MQSYRLALIGLLALLGALSAVAQTATLSANDGSLSPNGGSVVLTATTTYDGAPGALGWSIELPANWTLESVSGTNVPQVSPETGATGTLEFAYTAVPAARAEFTLIVRYPAGAASIDATSTVLVRADGKLTTLKPAAVQLRVPEVSGGDRRPDNRTRN
jgi:hypothetical protein